MAVNYGELEVSTTLDGEVNGDIQEGAGEGTTNYNHLINKPSINDIELVGNKSLEDLGIATSLADLADDEEHRTVSDEEKTIWNNKSDFSGDYNDLQNKPDIPTKLSDLEEDSGHQTITIAERANWNQKADRNEVPDSLSDLDDDAYHRLVTDAEKVAWNAKSDFSGSYDDLTNKPDIPDELSDLEDMAINNPQDGQTVKYDSASGKWKNSDSTSGDAYKSIKVADTLIIANGEDTLELVAGTNVTLTPDPVTKKVTINSTGGGGTSTGDMLKAIYDTNNDGIVDSAETLKGLEASVSELNYVKGVTNNIQTQLNSKAETSAIPDDLADLNDDSTHRLVTDTEKSAWNAKSDFSGSYNDLTDKPTIPAAQVQSDWGQTNNQAVDFIKNKPTIPDDLADLNDDSTHRLVTDTEKTTWNNKSDFSGSYNDLTDKPTIPDAQIQSDWNQTDDTKKDFIKNKPSIPSGQIQSDWNQSDSAEVDYIKNKPQNLVQDASYVHTDNNFTSTLKDKLDGIANGAEVNVQSDWNQTTDTADDYIKNKPTLGTAAAKNSTNGIIENSTDLIESGAVYTGLNGKLDASLKGANSGLAELDANGKVPSSQLPSFVDDVVEGYYNSDTDRFYEESTYEHVITPVSGKSWVDVATNKSYRWTGSVYVRVDEGVQLGETSDTAYRGDRGKAAYDHSQDSGKVSSATAVGLYKVGVTAQGHISSLTAVEKSDITELGIPAQDTTYSKATASADGLMSKEDFSKLDGIESGAQVNAITGVKGDAETNYRTGNVNMTPANIGLGNVDNTSDATKKTNFTGSIASDNTGFVTGGDAYTALDGKVDKEDGKGLSSNDYTTEEKEELAEAVEQLSTDTTTVTGNPLTFNLASEQVAESCLINLNPIQDLQDMISLGLVVLDIISGMKTLN